MFQFHSKKSFFFLIHGFFSVSIGSLVFCFIIIIFFWVCVYFALLVYFVDVYLLGGVEVKMVDLGGVVVAVVIR